MDINESEEQRGSARIAVFFPLCYNTQERQFLKKQKK